MNPMQASAGSIWGSFSEKVRACICEKAEAMRKAGR